MTNVMKNQKGFTLLEIIVVLAVLGALAAMLSPVVFRYIDDANRARAAADTRTIAAAIQQMYKDTGRWPFYADGDGATAYASATDAAFLSSLSTCDLAGGDDVEDANCMGTATLSATWVGNGDSIVRHLVTNSGAAGTTYAVTGPRAWRGPYTEAIPGLDPWGNPYFVNIGGAATGKAVFVISGGPDGTVETAADTAAATNLGATDDDVIARVR
jgi:prepilin-type N-terminal cleavage/methylation domain-containing protein